MVAEKIKGILILAIIISSASTFSLVRPVSAEETTYTGAVGLGPGVIRSLVLNVSYMDGKPVDRLWAVLLNPQGIEEVRQIIREGVVKFTLAQPLYTLQVRDSDELVLLEEEIFLPETENSLIIRMPTEAISDVYGWVFSESGMRPEILMALMLLAGVFSILMVRRIRRARAEKKSNELREKRRRREEEWRRQQGFWW